MSGTQCAAKHETMHQNDSSREGFIVSFTDYLEHKQSRAQMGNKRCSAFMMLRKQTGRLTDLGQNVRSLAPHERQWKHVDRQEQHREHECIQYRLGMTDYRCRFSAF